MKPGDQQLDSLQLSFIVIIYAYRSNSADDGSNNQGSRHYLITDNKARRLFRATRISVVPIERDRVSPSARENMNELIRFPVAHPKALHRHSRPQGHMRRMLSQNASRSVREG